MTTPKWTMPTDEESYKLFQRHCSESPVKVGFRNLSASNRWMSEEGDVWRTAWCACRDSINPDAMASMKPVTIAPLDEGELGELIKKQHPRLARMMPDPYVEVIFDAAKMAYRAAEARILKGSE